MGDELVGVCGWSYRSWRSDFYPAGLGQADELGYLSKEMNSVELDATFYRLQKPASFTRWRGSVPSDFVFTVKGGRFITHMLRLRDARQALANFYASGVLLLGAQLGPFLWQLPDRTEFDVDRLRAFLKELPRSLGEASALAAEHDHRSGQEPWAPSRQESNVELRHAVEVRHPSFCSDESAELFAEQGVALVHTDWGSPGDIRVMPDTSDTRYVRLHGAAGYARGSYSDAQLWHVVEFLRSGRSRVRCVYFNNDYEGCAPRDAIRLLRMLKDE